MIIIKSKYFSFTIGPVVFSNYVPVDERDELYYRNGLELKWKQKKELGIIGYWIIYIIEFLVRLIFINWSWKKAKENIALNRELYTNRNNLAYTKFKPLFGFYNYY